MDYENLSDRKKQILFKSIDDYIKLASPITSSSVHKKHLSHISPATLRNELSALEAMGYLKQLHTSSGRIPTTKAYRLYVNELMGSTKFNKAALESVREILTRRTGYLNDIISSIAGVISKTTNYPTFVVLNGYDNLLVESIRIIPLINMTALLLLGTKNGIVNGQFSLNGEATEESCIDASNLLTKKFNEKTIKYLRENIENEFVTISKEIDSFKFLFNNLIDCLSDMISQNSNVVRYGETKLLNNPEYSNLESAKQVLNLLDSDKDIKEIFASSVDDKDDITFTIGRENSTKGMESCSVVKANCRVNGKNIASIGVIGPERMDYGNVASALNVIVSELYKLNYLTSENEENKKSS